MLKEKKEKTKSAPTENSNTKSQKSWDIKLLLLLSLLGILLVVPAMGREVLFDFSDAKDDDKGPGYYIYPEWEVFNDGCFDMRRFRVIKEDKFIVFEITFEGEIIRNWREGSDRWTGDNGWILQNIDIYIDTDRKKFSGQKITIPGRNILFNEDSYWEKMVLIAPQRKTSTLENLKNRSENTELQKLVENNSILVPGFFSLKKYQIIAKIDIKDLGNPEPWWGWQVLVSGNDQQETNISFHTRRVSSFKDRYSFGGGSDYNGDPNVLDILSESKEMQNSWLKNYVSHPDSKKNRYAVIGNLSMKNRPVEKNEFELPKKDYMAILEKIRQGAMGGNKKQQEHQDIGQNDFTMKPFDTAKHPEQNVVKQSNPVLSGQNSISENQQAVNRTKTDNSDQIIDIDSLYGRVKEKKSQMNQESTSFTSNKNSMSKVSDSTVIKNKKACQRQMYTILNAARDYHKHNPQDSNITLLDLIYGGYFKEKISCPSGGKYAIYGEENNEIKVRCFNPGGVEHGSVP